MSLPSRPAFSVRPVHADHDDPTQWARQTATLHAVQALTTEVAAQAAPEAPYRGVRWLRDVLRSSSSNNVTERPRPPALQLQPVERQPSGGNEIAGPGVQIRRRGIVVGGDGQWQCPSPMANHSSSSYIPRSLLGLPEADPIPRQASLQLAGRPRLRSLVHCPSQRLYDSDDDSLSPQSRASYSAMYSGQRG
eukprot:EG_transcript_4450